MARDSKSFLMVIYIRAIIYKVRLMGTASTNGQMVMYTMDNGIKVSNKDMEFGRVFRMTHI